MHRILVFLTITLFVFNLLIPSFARELSVQEQAKRNAKQDMSGIRPTAHASFGLCFSSCGLLLGSYLGYQIGTAINDVPVSGLWGDSPSDEQSIGCLAGAMLLGGVAAPVLLYLSPYPSPSSERLIGKSPAYVEAYTQAYQKLRKKYVITGSLLVSLPLTGMGSVILSSF